MECKTTGRIGIWHTTIGNWASNITQGYIYGPGPPWPNGLLLGLRGPIGSRCQGHCVGTGLLSTAALVMHWRHINITKWSPVVRRMNVQVQVFLLHFQYTPPFITSLNSRLITSLKDKTSCVVDFRVKLCMRHGSTPVHRLFLATFSPTKVHPSKLTQLLFRSQNSRTKESRKRTAWARQD